MKVKQLVYVLPVLIACGGGGGGVSPGVLALSIYGEEFIEDGIPSAVFFDGWSATFSKFLVSVGSITAARGESPADFSDTSSRIFDLHVASNGKGHPIMNAKDLPGGRYDNLGFVVGPPPATGAIGGNATADDIALMRAGNFGIYFDATFTKGTVTKRARLGFPNQTRYGKCESTALVDGDLVGSSQLTIHADHFLYDDLFAETPNVAFDLPASADADGDGEITEAELAAVDLSTQARYQVGSTGIDNLWDFFVYQSSSVGHIDGEGHCAEAIRVAP